MKYHLGIPSTGVIIDHLLKEYLNIIEQHNTTHPILTTNSKAFNGVTKRDSVMRLTTCSIFLEFVVLVIKTRGVLRTKQKFFRLIILLQSPQFYIQSSPSGSLLAGSPGHGSGRRNSINSIGGSVCFSHFSPGAS